MWGAMRGKSFDTPRIKVTKPRGRHPHKRLNALRVRSESTPGRYADGNGLYLVVDPSAAKRWILRIVIAGKRCDLGLGSTQLVSLVEARDEALRLRALARKGLDVLAERRATRRVIPTFADAAREVHKQHSAAFRNDKHKAQWLASLEADIFPVLGDRRLDSIASADILKALTPIWSAKPETARRLKQRMKVVLDWAKASGFRSGENPVDGVSQVLPKHKAQQVHHPALPYRSVPAFLQSLHQSDAGEATKLAFEFLILTAARTTEVLKARWDEVDQDSKTWTVPAERSKSNREHRVPLSPRCLELLKEAGAIADGGPYIFPGRSAKKSLSNMAFLMCLRRLKRDDITAHGFRSTFRDWAAEKTNFPSTLIESALAHVVKNKTEAAYFRSDLFELRRKLMNTWSKFASVTPAAVVQSGA